MGRITTNIQRNAMQCPSFASINGPRCTRMAGHAGDHYNSERTWQKGNPYRKSA